MSRAILTIVTAVLGSALLPAAAHAADPFEMLGDSADYTLVAMSEAGSGTSAGFLQLGSAAHVFGSVGGRYRIETASGAIVDGDAHSGTGGSLHGGTVLGSDVALDPSTWGDVYAEAAATAAAAGALEATPVSGSPVAQCTTAGAAADSMGSLVLSANRDAEGLSVYEIDGCLYLGPGDTLLIEGTPEDRFVVRVTGGMRLERGSAIELDGIPGAAVLFSLEGGGWEGEPWAQVTAEDGPAGPGASLSGVFLSPDMHWQLGDGTLMPDTRILAGGVQANIQDMHPTDDITGSSIEDEEPGGDDTGDHNPGDGGTGGDDPGCSSDDPCPWWGGIIVEESGSTSGASDTTPGSSHGSVEASESATGSSAAGCSAGALGASWVWFMGAGLAAARRRRSG